MKFKKLTAIALAAVMSITTLAGCGGMDKNKTIATLGDQKVTLGLANFLARYQQATYDDVYKQFGYDDIWSLDSGAGDGTTMEDSVKESTMQMLHTYYTLKLHMSDYNVTLSDDTKKEITEVATKFMEANTQEALDELGATQEIVEELLTLYTIYSLMNEAISAEVDTNVSDEEANMRAFDQIAIPYATHTDDEGNTVEYTEDEKKEIKEKAQELLGKVRKKDATFKECAKEYGYTASDRTYDKDDTALLEDLKKGLDAMKAGDAANLIETENTLYIVKVTAETDKEATEENRESIIEQRKSDHFNEVVEGWQKDDGWEVNSKVLAEIKFDDSFTTTVETEGTEDSESDVVEEEPSETDETEDTEQTPEESEETEAQ